MIKRNILNPDLVENKPWICPKCAIIDIVEIFPYGLLSDTDIININSSSSMRILDMIPEFEIVSATSKMNDMSSSDIDKNLPGNINCKYFTNEEFSKLPNKKTP